MLVIKPLWVAHVPQDATIYSGELRSKADVRSYTKKSKYKNIWTLILHFFFILRRKSHIPVRFYTRNCSLKTSLFLPISNFCYIFLILPLEQFMHIRCS